MGHTALDANERTLVRTTACQKRAAFGIPLYKGVELPAIYAAVQAVVRELPFLAPRGKEKGATLGGFQKSPCSQGSYLQYPIPHIATPEQNFKGSVKNLSYRLQRRLKLWVPVKDL